MQLAFLRKAAGAAAVPCPQIDIGGSFNTVIKAALGGRAGDNVFSPYTNDVNFLLSEHSPPQISATPGEQCRGSIGLQLCFWFTWEAP